MKTRYTFLPFPKILIASIVMVFIALALGCEKDNSDAGAGDSGGGAPSSVAGTWAGGGISVKLVETSMASDGRSEGSATLTNPYGSFGGAYTYGSGTIYAQGDGWGLDVGTVSGDEWNANYINTWDDTMQYLVLIKQ